MPLMSHSASYWWLALNQLLYMWAVKGLVHCKGSCASQTTAFLQTKINRGQLYSVTNDGKLLKNLMCAACNNVIKYRYYFLKLHLSCMIFLVQNVLVQDTSVTFATPVFVRSELYNQLDTKLPNLGINTTDNFELK